MCSICIDIVNKKHDRKNIKDAFSEYNKEILQREREKEHSLIFFMKANFYWYYYIQNIFQV